jgi:hypothetical protein
MTTQIQIDSTPRFPVLSERPFPPKRTTLRLARLVGWAGSLLLSLMLVLAFFPNFVAPYDAT